MRHSIKLAFLFLLTAMSQAAVIYNQPPSSTSFPSAVNTVDNPTYQDRLRDRFRFTTATTIREIRWRGSFDESAPIGFTVKIFDFTVGSAAQLNQAPVVSVAITGTAGQAPAGIVAGVQRYDYRLVLPTPFAALGNNKDYWLEIIAQQTGVPDWSWTSATGGDGNHFVRLNGPFTDSGYYGTGVGDCAFTLYDTVENPDVLIGAVAGPGGGGTVTGAGTYPAGTSVTVKASAAAGYKFTNWKEGATIVSTSASYTFTPTVYRDLQAHFTGGPARSTITTSGLPASGCATQGGGSYALGGGVVELAAEPKEFFTFQGWYENDVLVTTNPTLMIAPNGAADRHLVARSSASSGGTSYSTRRLISVPPGAGAVTGGGVFQGYNITRPITATPPPGRSFLYWTNGGSTVSYSATYTPPAFSIYDIFYAHFSAEIIVTATASPASGGATSGAGIFQNIGDPVNITATPEPGYAFVSWTRGTATVSTAPTLSFSAGAGGYNDNLVANFVAVRTISTTAAPLAAGTTTTGTANDGSPVTVTATANVGYTFSEWTEGGVTVSASATYTFTAMAARNLVANFHSEIYGIIEVSAAPAIGGTVTGGGVFNLGDDATVSATPKPGYTFYRWTMGGFDLGWSADYTFTLDGNYTLVATFVKLPAFAAAPAAAPETMTITWPADAVGWVLQESADLIAWWDSSKVPVIVGTQQSVTISTIGESRYFRLVYP